MMEIRRVIGRLASRWLVLVIAGLVGAIGAFVFVQQRNSEVQPVYNAQATVAVPVPVDSGGGDGRGSSNSISDELAVALEIAKTENEAEVRLPTRFIEADAETNSLIFVAIDETELSAIAAAIQMRAAYVAADPNFDTDAELANNLAEADLISARLDELLPEVVVVEKTPEELAAQQSELEVLTAQQGAINDKISELTTTKIESDDAEEIASLDEQIAEFKAELELLLVTLLPLQTEAEEDAAPEPEPAEPDLPISDQWTVNALQERLGVLETESAELIVASVTGQSIDLPETEVTDESPSETPPWLAVLVGFIAAIVIWSAVLIGFDRARGIVWHASDVKGYVVLAEGPAYPLGADDLTELERQRRKRSVQAIRSAIISAGRGDNGTVVGFAAPMSTDSLVREDLAYDVAASVSTVGRSVLVVDLGFRQKSGLEAFLMGEGGGLRELFDSVVDDEETIRNRAAAVIAGADTLSPGLDVLVADSDVIDPADILAGRPLSELLQQAGDQYDVVVVVQPTTTVVSGAGVDAYLHQQVIVCTRGRTRVSEISAEAINPSAGHVQMVGVAILAPDAPSGKGGASESATTYASTPAGRRSGREAEKAPSPRRPTGQHQASEATVDRIRALESYSVDESAFIESSEPPADSA